MTRRGMIGVLAVGAAVLLTGCGDDRWPDYNYKMTVYVGGKAFSTVRRVEQKEGFSAADSSGRSVTRSLQGEAVIIELGEGRTYYALLGKPDEPEYAQKVAGYALLPLVPEFERDPRFDDYHNETDADALGRSAEQQQKMVAIKGPQALPRTRPSPDPYRGPRQLDNWPMFVTFDDPKDPKTVREASPDSIGVSKVSIEIVDEEVTTGIDVRLDKSFWDLWIANHYKQMREGGGAMNNPYFRSLLPQMSRDKFVTGDDN
jgi:hypothetical protein